VYVPPESTEALIPDRAVPPAGAVLPAIPDAAPPTGCVFCGAADVMVSVPAVVRVAISPLMFCNVVTPFCGPISRRFK
jgi:hypothetical protein